MMDTSIYRAELVQIRRVIELGQLDAMTDRQRREALLTLVDSFIRIIDAVDAVQTKTEPLFADIRALHAKNAELCGRLEALGVDISEEDRDPPAARPH